jgi:S1-C subfamily serine protease
MKQFPLTLLLVLIFIAADVQASIECPLKRDFQLDKKDEFLDEFGKSFFKVWAVSTGPEKTTEPLGTATLISDKGYLLTAAHLFYDVDGDRIIKGVESGELEIHLTLPMSNDGSVFEKYRAKIVKRLSNDLDVALLKIDDDLWEYNNVSEPVSLDFKVRPMNQSVTLIGYPVDRSDQIISSIGSIVDISADRRFIQATDLEIYQGFSGGVLINSKGLGVAVFSGAYVINEEDEVNWSKLGHRNNEALNAVPMITISDYLTGIQLEEVDSIARNLVLGDSSFPVYRINGLMENDSFQSIVLSHKILELIEDNKINNSDNQVNALLFASCMLYSERLTDFYKRVIAKLTNSWERSRVAQKVASIALDKARDADDLDESMGMFELFNLASVEAGVRESVRNYAMLDYYKNASQATIKNNLVVMKSPSKILKSAFEQMSQGENLSGDELEMVLKSRSLLYSAAAAELRKKGEIYSGSLAAISAFKASPDLTSFQISDVEFFRTVGLRKVENNEERASLESALRALKEEGNGRQVDTLMLMRSTENIPQITRGLER